MSEGKIKSLEDVKSLVVDEPTLGPVQCGAAKERITMKDQFLDILHEVLSHHYTAATGGVRMHSDPMHPKEFGLRPFNVLVMQICGQMDKVKQLASGAAETQRSLMEAASLCVLAIQALRQE